MKIYVLVENDMLVKWVRDYKLEMAEKWRDEQPGREVVPVEEAT